MVQHFSKNKATSELQAKLIGNLQVTIDGFQEDINKIDLQLDTIRNQLQRLGLRFSESFGLARDNLNDLTKINAVDIELLSSHDLTVKQHHLEHEKKDLQQEIHNLRMKIKEIEDEAKKKKLEEQRVKMESLNKAYVHSFKSDPGIFFAGIYANPPTISKLDQLLNSADQIIAVCEYFDSSIDPRNLWLSWDILERARKGAEENNIDDRAIYIDGTEKLLGVLCRSLPPGMQGLKFLFKAKEYEKVDWYMKQVFLEDTIIYPLEYNQLLEQLARDVEHVSKMDAGVFLAHTNDFYSDFNKFSPAVQDDIVAQKAYLDRVEFDLSYLDNAQTTPTLDAIRAEVDLLKKNIYNFLHKDVKVDFKENQRIFLEHKARIEELANNLQPKHIIKFGAGLGMGWDSQKNRKRPKH